MDWGRKQLPKDWGQRMPFVLSGDLSDSAGHHPHVRRLRPNDLDRTVSLIFVDIFLCETVSSIAETSNILKAIKNKAKQDKKIWLSWTLLEDQSGRLRSKETIEDAFQFAESFDPDAYLFNCTDPIAITEGIKKLSKLTDKPIGCYPNVFGVPFDWTLDNDVQVEPRNLSVKQFIEYKNLWEDLGASIIGGCCGIGPEYIKAVS